ncbi:MAG: DUF554 domain-containing protein [Atribacterota bacterium]|nr:DUF554 domain-containing protein [Atribacterota bacterium]
MLGTIVNSLAIVFGCIVGLFLKERFPEKIGIILFQGIGLTTLMIGVQMAVQGTEILPIIVSILLGGMVGELINIEKRLNQIGNSLKDRFSKFDGNEKFTEGFIAASLLFCVGSMAIMGAIEEGINNNSSILFAKSALDGISSIIFSASLGIGVLFSAIPVFIYQGIITQIAQLVKNLITVEMITQMTAVGGILIIGLGINILEIKKIKVANLLPSIFIILIFTAFL